MERQSFMNRFMGLTTPQRNIWNLHKYYGGTSITNLCGAVFYKEKRDSKILRQAICCFIQNQSGIRLRLLEDEEPVQYVSDKIDENIQVMEFSSIEEFECFAEKFAKESKGVLNVPLYRFVIFHVEEKSGVLVMLNHLIADAWTFGLAANQFEASYQKMIGKDGFPILEGDYRKFISSENEYLISDRYRKDKAYWEEKYTVCPKESRIKLYNASQTSIQAKRITRTLPLDLERNMDAYCNACSVTHAVLFETALFIYLSKMNLENHSITIGVPVLNRCNAKEKKIAGMFVSTMPLTITFSEGMTVDELEDRIGKEHRNIFRHQKYPYIDILKFLREKRDFSGNLYDVMVSYQNAKTYTDSDTKWYSNGFSEVPFIMHIDNRDGHVSHTINIDYQTAVFRDEAEVEYVAERLEYILEQIVQDSARTIGDIHIVPQRELKQIVYGFNDTYMHYSEKKCVHELFFEQVKRTPGQIALVFEGKKFTYRQLEEMSNSLARLLREKGVERSEVIPIIAERRWQIVVAILGVLKAGGAYMPLDPSCPVDRIQYIVREAKSRIGCVLGYKEILEGIELLDLEQLDFEKAGNDLGLPINNCNEIGDMCYVIFTSGSTGLPKGVMIKHENLYNYLMSVQGMYGIKKYRMSLITNFYVDLSVSAIFLPLISGEILEVVDQNPAEGLSYIVHRKNHVYKLTPTHIDMMCNMDLSLPAGTSFIIGGEALKRKNLEYVCSDARLLDEYGPTETTVGCCIKIYEKNVAGNFDISIGRPIYNTQIYILDQFNNVVPIGVPGELCIAGDGVGLGYLNRPDLTDEKFVPNPFAAKENHHGKIMYRTGDLACWRTDGEIEYLGRIDTQVKIRGLRIELEEIENVMSGIKGVKLSVVTDGYDKDDRQYLAAYYTADAEIDEKELRRCLSLKLPQYMIPNYFIHLDDIPMTVSGKTDRKNLPIPDFTIRTREYVEPRNEEEKKLCRLLEKLLRIEEVGIEDNFFELGGDSLTAIEYVAKAHVLGIHLELQDVFDFPTVECLCKVLKKGKKIDIHYNYREFEKYSWVLKQNVIDETFMPVKKSLGNILLTGATGFLGVHVLVKLLQEEENKIYCLVRENEKTDGYERVFHTLSFYFGSGYETDARIIPIVGDIEQEKLSDNLPKDIQTVIHTAASVKHYGPYDYFWNVNVEGTRHVIDYARSIGARLIHISTLSVSGNGLGDDLLPCRQGEEEVFSEASMYIGQALDNVYIRSKFEAEKSVYDAMLEGMDAKVIRVGNLTNRVLDYKFQLNYRENAFLKRIRALLEFGIFPDYLMSMQLEFSPVDLVAEGIVKIAEYADRQCVFHLNNPRTISFRKFFKLVHKLGISMETAEGAIFDAKLQEVAKNNRTEYIFEAFQNDINGQGRLAYESNICVKNDFTVWFLEKVGFKWKDIDEEYIKGYLEYFRRLGYLNI